MCVSFDDDTNRTLPARASLTTLGFLLDKKHAFAMITELFSPRSKGTVTLKSTDPLENPIVDCNYLSDPLDVLVISEGCRLGNEIVMNGAGTKDIVKGSWPSSESLGPQSQS